MGSTRHFPGTLTAPALAPMALLSPLALSSSANLGDCTSTASTCLLSMSAPGYSQAPRCSCLKVPFATAGHKRSVLRFAQKTQQNYYASPGPKTIPRAALCDASVQDIKLAQVLKAYCSQGISPMCLDGFQLQVLSQENK